jgi:hypothetical protein
MVQGQSVSMHTRDVTDSVALLRQHQQPRTSSAQRFQDVMTGVSPSLLYRTEKNRTVTVKKQTYDTCRHQDPIAYDADSTYQ